MTNFEKIDDYLANRLPAEEKAAFEQAMEGDPALKSEVGLQGQIINGIQQARAAELKHMLQQAPVPSSGWTAGQVTAGVLFAGILGAGLYFYLRPAPEPLPTTPEVVTQPAITPESTPAPEATEEEKVVEQPRKETTAPPKTKTVTPVQKPNIQVTDPSAELTDSSVPEVSATPERTEISVSKMDVVTMAPDKKYTFHYQFTDNKLHLYGPFDKNLYEILEINGDSHAVFLFYKENYYLLDEAQHAITPLTAIRDGQLLKKLREYRSR